MTFAEMMYYIEAEGLLPADKDSEEDEEDWEEEDY